jgi:hypothetical protein
MSNLGDKVVGDIQGKLADAQAQVRYAGEDTSLDGTITEAVCTGLERSKENTEQGQYRAIEGLVRYKKADEPDAWGAITKDDESGEKVEIPIMGQLVEVLLSPDTDFDDGTPVKARVRNRMVQGGAVRLDVEAEFQED